MKASSFLMDTPQSHIPTKAKQRFVFMVLFSIWIGLVGAGITYAIIVDRTVRLQDRSAQAITAIEKFKPVAAPPDPVIIQKAKDAASAEVDQKVNKTKAELENKIERVDEKLEQHRSNANQFREHTLVFQKKVKRRLELK